MNTWKRNCPVCGTEITYSGKDACKLGEKTQARCQSCSKSSWTKELNSQKDMLIKLYTEGLSIQKISKRFNCDKQILTKYFKKWGVTIRGKEVKFLKVLEPVQELFEKGFPNVAIADELGIGCWLVKRALKYLGLKSREYREPLKLAGMRFGKLVVIEKVGHNNRSEVLWKCICDCGKETTVKAYNLTKRRTESCGCIAHGVPRSGTGAFRKLFRSYRNGAKYRNFSFELTEEQFKILVKQNCYYCGQEPASIQQAGFRRKEDMEYYIYNGIDRIDSNQGYTLENCVTACCTCNRMKLNLSIDEFYNKIKTIYKNKCLIVQ